MEILSGSRLVAIVVDPGYGDRLGELEAKMPIWAVKSPANTASWGLRKSVHQNSAFYSVESVDAPEDNVLTALVDVDEHFGVNSFPKAPYQGIRVIGMRLTPEIEVRMRPYGYVRFEEADDGFLAYLSNAGNTRDQRHQSND